MKKITSIILLTIGILTGNSSIASAQTEYAGIDFFQGTWEEALEKAKSENKLIFLDAYAAWCGPCKMLKRNVFPNPEVGALFNEHFINFAMDMEKGIGRQIAQKYGVTAYPTLYFIDGEGTVIKKAIGYHNVQQMIMLGQAMVELPSTP